MILEVLLQVSIVFDDIWQEAAKKITNGADGSQDKLVKELQESFEANAKALITRGQRVKNRYWYDPGLIANWRNKGDNSIDIIEVKEPSDLSTQNDHGKYAKKLYTDGGNTKKTPRVTRELSIYAQLSSLGRVIQEMTGMLPRHTNSIEFDSKTGAAANTKLQACKTTRDKLILVVSEWDYNDLKAGAHLIGTATKSLTLDDVASGIRVIAVPGIAPGHMFIGEDIFLIFFMKLKRTGSIFHWREEETQYYTNIWLAVAVFTKMVCGKVILPCKNYCASPEFYNKFSTDIK